ncbi:MAG: DUF4255 domain-containing protein [Ferruginibacter sp.]
MIATALSFLAEEMNIYFSNKGKLTDDKVIVSALISQDSTISIQGENKIVITLINIEEDLKLKNQTVITRPHDRGTQPANIILTVLFSAYFSPGNYTESLRFISFVISFFNENPVFTMTAVLPPDPSIQRLSVEMVNADAQKLHFTWTTLGAKYMPSVIYKVMIMPAV